MWTKLLEWQDGRVLLSAPNARQYGHLGLEILMSLGLARESEAALCLLRSRRPVNAALYELETPVVRMVRPGALGATWLRLHWACDLVGGELRERRYLAAEDYRREMIAAVSEHLGNRNLPRELREWLRSYRKGLTERDKAARRDLPAQPLYYRRRMIRERIPVSLRAEVRERAAHLANDLGIAGRFVCVHAREPGFKHGRETQDKQRLLGKPVTRDDTIRNARIESYFDAIDYLVDRGYGVVRIGDPSMTPVRRKGVVDLATSPLRTEGLEVYCLLECRFLLTGDAGPVGVSYLTNTPLLVGNAPDPISAYPIRSDGLYILKKAFSRRSGRQLSPIEMLGEPHMTNVRNPAQYHYVDNTSDEIVAAVEEMEAGLAEGWRESDGQVEFRRQAAMAGEMLRSKSAYVRKWGTDDGFLGDGRLARFYADRYL